MHRYLPACVTLAALLLAGVADAQKTSIPIGDLTGDRRSLLDDTERSEDMPVAWIRRSESAMWPSRGRLLAGEHILLRPRDDDHTAIDVTNLAGVLAGLSGIEDREIETSDAALTVPDHAAQIVHQRLLDLRPLLTAAVQLDVTLESVSGQETSTLLSGQLILQAGEPQFLTDVLTEDVLTDFDVEIAQGAVTANPVVRTLVHGSCMVARALPIPGDEAVVIETIVRTATPLPKEEIRIDHPGFGSLDRVHRTLDECGVSFRIANGALASHEWTDATGRRLRLRCQPSWSAGESSTRDAVVYTSPLLNTPLLGFRSQLVDGRTTLQWLDERVTNIMHTQNADHADLILVSTRDDASHGTIAWAGPAAADLAASFRQRVDRAVSPAEISVSVTAVPVAGADAAVETSPILEVSGPVITDLPVSYSRGEELGYLRDWNVEVAQSARIPDPQIVHATGGYALNLMVVNDQHGRPRAVEIDCTLLRLGEIRQVQVPINMPMMSPESVSSHGSGQHVSVGRVPPVAQPQDVVPIEKLSIARHQLLRRVPLAEDGTAEFRTAATIYLGADRELLVRVKVTTP